jgi:hypothetical protein
MTDLLTWIVVLGAAWLVMANRWWSGLAPLGRVVLPGILILLALGLDVLLHLGVAGIRSLLV